MPPVARPPLTVAAVCSTVTLAALTTATVTGQPDPHPLVPWLWGVWALATTAAIATYIYATRR